MAAELPLAFKCEGDECQLVVLVGLANNENWLLDGENRWKGHYVPSALRTPPFCLGTPPGAKPNQRVLCVERDNPWLESAGVEPLLDQHQQLTPAVKEVMVFLTDCEQHRVKTRRAVSALAAMGVLTPWQRNEPMPEGFLQIDEAAFAKLPDNDITKLRKLGALALAYTQMVSTHQLQHLKRLAPDNSAVDVERLFGDDDDDLSFDFGR